MEDAVTLREYRLKHNEVLSSRYGFASWAYVRQSTSILSMIDDHEVINDFAGGAHPSTDPRFDNTGNFINETDRYRNGLQAFFDYMPIRNTRYLLSRDERTFLKPKLYRSLRFGQDAMVAILDARSFRDEGLPPVQDLSNPAEVAQFIESSFDPNRTMLSKRQLVELLADLSLAQAAGVTWKFVMVPEPIQNLGVVNAPDRFEGYAAERTKLLNYIRQHKIDNVVFVSADIHGTLVNNLSYQVAPFATQIPTDAWEISTGSVAFNMPFGQTVAALAAQLGLLTPQEKAFYDSLPVANDPDDLPNDKDDFIKGLVNTQLSSLGYNALGLQGSRVSAKLLEGDYVAAHTFGWTEFQIDKLTREMVVTTYGIQNYSEQELQAHPGDVTARRPEIVSQFMVKPVTH